MLLVQVPVWVRHFQCEVFGDLVDRCLARVAHQEETAPEPSLVDVEASDDVRTLESHLQSFHYVLPLSHASFVCVELHPSVVHVVDVLTSVLAEEEGDLFSHLIAELDVLVVTTFNIAQLLLAVVTEVLVGLDHGCGRSSLLRRWL